ncbi:hypothetical protein [Chloroflexus sp.]|uniref:hypothetical protein n=1 Tax=Chloroflexus sp. TaxID=1904827 RepID=UPI002ACE28AE|nr:hypothetical protein [Chloroflexus sp.]
MQFAHRWLYDSAYEGVIDGTDQGSRTGAIAPCDSANERVIAGTAIGPAALPLSVD